MNCQRRRFGLVPVTVGISLAFGLQGCRDRASDPGSTPSSERSRTSHRSVEPPLGAEPDRSAGPKKAEEKPLPAPERELARLKSEMGLLDKDIKQLVHHLARARVEVNQLKDQIDELATKQSKNKEVLDARAELVKNADGQVTFGNRTLTVADAQKELREGMERWAADQKLLDSQQLLLLGRTKVRDALEGLLQKIKEQKSVLTIGTDELHAEAVSSIPQPDGGKKSPDEKWLAKITKIEQESRGARERLKRDLELLSLPKN